MAGSLRASSPSPVRLSDRRTPVQVAARSVPRMTYSQPDPSEETTQAEAPEQPDTDREDLEERDDEQAALEIDADDVPTDGEDPGADAES